MLDISEITFMNYVIDDDHDAIVLYFDAPVELLPKKHKDAEFATMSIIWPIWYPVLSEITVSISPTKFDIQKDAYMDYDWTDLDISEKEIYELIITAKNSCKS